MIAVARSAGRSAQVSTDNERVIVDALVILGELIGRNLVSTHVAGVGMAASAPKAFLGMYVLAERLLPDPERIGQGRVTIQAGILGLPIPQADNQHDEAGQPDMAVCAERSELILPGGHRDSYLPCTRE